MSLVRNHPLGIDVFKRTAFCDLIVLKMIASYQIPDLSTAKSYQSAVRQLWSYALEFVIQPGALDAYEKEMQPIIKNIHGRRWITNVSLVRSIVQEVLEAYVHPEQQYFIDGVYFMLLTTIGHLDCFSNQPTDYDICSYLYPSKSRFYLRLEQAFNPDDEERHALSESGIVHGLMALLLAP